MDQSEGIQSVADYINEWIEIGPRKTSGGGGGRWW